MEPEKNLELGDAPGFIFPVFSKRALDCLSGLINKDVEVLPLVFDEQEFFGINVITVLDAIDYENSIYRTYCDGKRIMTFKKYAFISSVIKDVPIFKIKDEKTRYAFVSEDFKNKVEENNLLGFQFELVWNNEM